MGILVLSGWIRGSTALIKFPVVTRGRWQLRLNYKMKKPGPISNNFRWTEMDVLSSSNCYKFHAEIQTNRRSLLHLILGKALVISQKKRNNRSHVFTSKTMTITNIHLIRFKLETSNIFLVEPCGLFVSKRCSQIRSTRMHSCCHLHTF